MKRVVMIGVIAAFMGSFGMESSFAQNWPQWRGINRDGKAIDFKAPQQWPQELKQVWKKEVGFGDASPSLVDGKLYVFTRQGDEETIQCLDASNGDELWSDKYTAPAVGGPASSHPGPRSTPTVLEGKVVTLGVGGHLSCLDAATGKLLWRKNDYAGAVPRFFTSMSPAIVDGMCIAHLGGGDKGAIVAYDLNSGDEKWKWEGDSPAYASPVFMEIGGAKLIVVQTDKNLLGISISDGKVLWQVSTPASRRFDNAATPIVDGQTIYFTGQGTGMHAVKISKNGDMFSSESLWTNKETNVEFNTPVLKDGSLYGISNRGNLFCINAKTGESASAWSSERRFDRFGSIIDAGSVLLACSPKSELVVFKPNASQYEEVASIKVAESPVYAHPVLVGDRIIIKDEKSVIVYSVK